MMAQPQLNGAYYSPSIPPPQPNSHHRPTHNDKGGGGGSCGIGSCYFCCCCCGCDTSCFLGRICKILTTTTIIAAVVIFVFLQIVRPNAVKFRVTDTALTHFTYTNKTLHYNLALNITVRNSNRRIGLYYDSIETTAFYHDAWFDSQMLGNFFQHHKNTTVLSPVFKGQQVVPLSYGQGKKLNEDQECGVYRIDVKLLLKVRFKYGLIKTGTSKLNVRCGLHVPLKSLNGTVSETGFQATGCKELE